MTTNEKGDIAEWKVVIKAREKGLLVSKPLCDSARYDLILDDGKKLWRTQVKWADGNGHSDGGVAVQLRRHNRKGVGEKVYSIEEVDALIVYLPTADVFCWIPPSVFIGKTTLVLKTLPTKNNQSKGVHLVKDFIW